MKDTEHHEWKLSTKWVRTYSETNKVTLLRTPFQNSAHSIQISQKAKKLITLPRMCQEIAHPIFQKTVKFLKDPKEEPIIR